MTSALAALPRAATDIRSPLGSRALVSAGGRSALVTFQVPGPAADEVTAVAPALRAVAAIQGRYLGLRIAEAGDASVGRAINSVLGSGFKSALEGLQGGLRLGDLRSQVPDLGIPSGLEQGQ